MTWCSTCWDFRLVKWQTSLRSGTKGELDSYLIEITADILTRKDDEGQAGPIVDYILDAVGNKGTGKWTSQSSLDLGVPLPLITESVFARYISTYKDERGC